MGEIFLKDSLSDVTLQECLSFHHSLFVVPCQFFDVQNYLKVHPEFFGQKNLAGLCPCFPSPQHPLSKKSTFVAIELENL